MVGGRESNSRVRAIAHLVNQHTNLSVWQRDSESNTTGKLWTQTWSQTSLLMEPSRTYTNLVLTSPALGN